jgi:hypothetical protein
VSTKAAYQAVADDMGRRIAALLPEEYRGAYSPQARLVAEESRPASGTGETPAIG